MLYVLVHESVYYFLRATAGCSITINCPLSTVNCYSYSMDKLNYADAIKQILLQHLEYAQQDKTVETEVIFDDERGRYLLLNLGWEEEQRIYGCPIHVEIKGESIWIQRDFTETGIGNELIALSIPKERIVLAYRSPFVRQLTQQNTIGPDQPLQIV